MKRITIAITALFLLSTGGLFAQEKVQASSVATFGKKFYKQEPCAAGLYEKFLSAKYPDITSLKFQKALSGKVEAAKKRMAAKSGQSIINFPVVVHVIHDGDPVGSDENISDEQILSQITVLNQDFRKALGTPGYNENPIGADIEFEFCLARTNPQGQLTNGIMRYNMGEVSYDIETIELELKPDIQWDPAKYINIYVMRFGGPDLTGAGGYALFPLDSELEGIEDFNGLLPLSSDGIAMHYRAFGSDDIYPEGNYYPTATKGRTLSHEMGHYFGLRHIWGDEENCNGTDYCEDTPVTAGMNFGCTPIDSCPANDGDDMIENYMDYGDDTCVNVFTLDQKTRIYATIASSATRTSQSISNRCSEPTASTDKNLLKAAISVYPNPTQRTLFIASELLTHKANYVLYNALGQSVIRGNLSLENVNAIDIEQLANGIYTITISSGQDNASFKVIKQ